MSEVWNRHRDGSIKGDIEMLLGACADDLPRIPANWRRGWDSNPRYPCGYTGFQDRGNQPLCHPSAAREVYLLRDAGGRYRTGPIAPLPR
jgi:hypothetical protein